MKVLMQNRLDMFKIPGGDAVQLLKTKENLEKLGIEVDISLELRPNLQNYDVVHLFHISTDFHGNYTRYLNAKRQKKPVVLTPIYWNVNEFLKAGLCGLEQKVYYFVPNGIIRVVLSKIYNKDLYKQWWHQPLKSPISVDFKKYQNEILRSCDLILPNATIEAKLIERDFKIHDEKKFHVVPNAADEHFKYAKPDTFVSKYGLRDFVLCVGQIEERKNQLSLIEALKGTDLKLVLIGGLKMQCMVGYYKKCRKKADENVLFINWMKREELASAYAAAKVHALPSWYETPGLASLEAGLAGCNVVTTDRGSTKEYFRSYAWYCNPSDIKSIQNAVLDAFATNKSTKLWQHVLQNYTWEKTAEKTLEAYGRVLQK